MRRTPEPLAQVWGLLLPCWANPLFSSRSPDSIYSWIPTVTASPPPLSPCCCLPLPMAHTPVSSIRPQCQSHTLGFLQTRGIGKALRESIQLPPLTDEATWAPAAMWLAQGHSASWQESWDTNPRLLTTLNNSDDAQMSTKGLQFWARIESEDLRPLPGSWQHVPSQSGTHAWEGRCGTLCQHIQFSLLPCLHIASSNVPSFCRI